MKWVRGEPGFPGKPEATRTALWVALAFLLALAVRLYLPWQDVFTGTGIRFPGYDPWFYARQLERWLATFPAMPGNDPLLLYPLGHPPEVGILFGLLAASTALLLGLGHPSLSLLHEVAVFLPPLLGALCVVPAHALARRLLGPAEAIGTAFLLAVLPGGFLLRTSLGFVDHHALEALLSTAWLACTLAWMQRPSARKLVASGVLLGLYLLTWTSGLFLLAGLAGFLVVQSSLDFGRGKGPSPHLYAGTAALCAIASLVVLGGSSVAPPAAGALAGLGVLAGGVFPLRLLGGLRRNREPSALAGGSLLLGLSLLAAIIALAVLITALPRALVKLVDLADPARQVGEFAPLLYPLGVLDWRAVWQQLGPLPIAGAGGLVAMLWRWRRNPDPPTTFFLVWGLWTFLALLSANRFVLYAALPVTVLAVAGVSALARRAARLRSPLESPRSVTAILWLLLALLAVPCLEQARHTLGSFSGPTQNWVEALRWLRRNSPEPADYGVLAWWDTGYWISHIAGRAPLANPTQRGASEVASLLLLQEAGSVAHLLRERGVRYLAADDRHLLLPGPASGYLRGEFPAFVRWAGRPLRDYVEIFQLDAEGAAATAMAFKPAYFQTLAVRLALYGGAAAAPPGPVQVAELAAPPDSPGLPRVIRRLRNFPSYREARRFLEGQDPELHQILSFQPTATCVPLERLPLTPLGTFGSSGAGVRLFEIPPLD